MMGSDHDDIVDLGHGFIQRADCANGLRRRVDVRRILGTGCTGKANGVYRLQTEACFCEWIAQEGLIL